MVTVCLICGDEGLSETLILCDKCKAYAVHSYCIVEYPKSLEENLVWSCESCELKVAEPSHFQQSLQARDNDTENLDFAQAAQFDKLKKTSPARKLKRKNYVEKPREQNTNKKRKVAQGSDLQLSRPARESDAEILFIAQPIFSGLRHQTKNRPVRESKRKNLARKLTNNKNRKKYTGSLAKSKVQNQNSPLLQLDEMCYSEHFVADEKVGRKLRVDEGISNEEDIPTKATVPFEGTPYEMAISTKAAVSFEDNTNEEATSTSTREHGYICVQRGMDCGNSNEGTGTDKNETSPASIGENINIIANAHGAEYCYFPAQPIFEPIWRGSFCISSEKFRTVAGLVAHLSSLSCAKVHDTARLLPELLSLELIPRSDAWPKCFQKWGPCDHSIGLYFFPLKESNDTIFDSLVDMMISKDLAMKADLQVAELLLFTSNVLPLQLWKFQAKFYLWGVFKGKQSSNLTEVVGGDEKDNKKASSWYSR